MDNLIRHYPSSTFLRVTAASRPCVFEVQPQHVSTGELIRKNGRLVAVKLDGQWLDHATLNRLDPRTEALLEALPMVEG